MERECYPIELKTFKSLQLSLNNGSGYGTGGTVSISASATAKGGIGNAGLIIYEHT